MARTLLLGLAFAAIPIVSAVAAPATPEEAARLTGLFERYVGHPASGEPSSVAVVPKGDGYAVALDVKRALSGLGSFGYTFDPWTFQATLTPLPDGTWKVVSDGSTAFGLHEGDKTISSSSATDRFEGIYDPGLRAFATAKQEVTGYDTTQTASTLVQRRHADRSILTATGKAAEGGTVGIATRYDLTGLKGEFLEKPASEPTLPGAGNPAVPPPSRSGTSVSYAAPTGTVDVSLDRLRTGNLLDLWAFLVAHPTRDGLAAVQDEFKALLRAGIPFADGLKERGSVETLAVTTPVGVVSMTSLGGDLDLSGLAGTGRAALALSIAGLAVPTEQLPPWSTGLVPTGLDLHLAVDGFHAAEAATETINDIDLKKEVIITQDQKDAVFHLLWPGSGTLALAPSRITTRTLDLTMEGQAAIGAGSSGRVTVRGKGLDAEIAALQAQAATDPGASQVLSPLVLAKNLAKPDPDGTLVWVIEFGDGPLKVNGAPLQ